MIRSAYDLEWEARMWRGARDAELRAISDFMRPMAEAGRQIGIAFRQLAEAMGRAIMDLNRALAASFLVRTERGPTERP